MKITYRLPEEIKQYVSATPETELLPIIPTNVGDIPKGIDVAMMRRAQKSPFPEEPEERYLPKNSFMTDFCMTYRGYEAPLIFWIWGSIFAVSSLLKRHAWMRFGFGQEFPNIFMMFVAPPGVAKKSTTLNAAVSVLRKSVEYIQDPKVKVLRAPHIINDATEEAMHQELTPKKILVDITETDDMGGQKTYTEPVNTGSNATIVANEMTSIVSKKKYQTGIVTKLTSLYDCKDDDDRLTVSHGHQRLENIFVTLAGATTPGAIKSQFPEDALSGGLISRMSIIYADDSPRKFPLPIVYNGAPSPDELAKRLAWIAETAHGEYTFTPMANEYHNTVLYEKISYFRRNGSERRRELYSRIDVMVRKLSVIIRAMEYRPGNEIDFEHLQLAWELMKFALDGSNQLLSNIEEGGLFGYKKRVVETIAKRGGMASFREIMQSLRRTITVDLLKGILAELIISEYILVHDEHGDEKGAPSFQGKEQYSLLEAAKKYSSDEEGDVLEDSYSKELEEAAWKE